MENIYSDVKRTNNERELGKILAEITWGCADCSPDNKEQCQECLTDILRHSMEEFQNS